MDNRLRSGEISKSIMFGDLEFNFDKILQLLSKTNFIYPDSSNIKTYDETTTVIIETSTTHSYKLVFNGTANENNSISYMIEIPNDYEKIKLNGETILETDLMTENNRSFLTLNLGIHKNENNETIGEQSEIRIQYEHFIITYELDVSGVVLE